VAGVIENAHQNRSRIIEGGRVLVKPEKAVANTGMPRVKGKKIMKNQ